MSNADLNSASAIALGSPATAVAAAKGAPLQSELLMAAHPEASLLGNVDRGFRGEVHAIAAGSTLSMLDVEELERRLLELGFVEGAKIEVLHEGAIGRDPIAVRVENTTVALRRREAMAIVVV